MTLLRGRDRARVWSRARPRSWMWPGRRNIDHTSHSRKAVQSAEVRVTASLRKSVFVNEPCIRKNSGITVHVIRRTELPVSCTRDTACDAVVITAPGPPHGVAHRNAQYVWDKPQFVSHRPHRHIENLAASQSPTAPCLPAILIENPDGCTGVLFRCCAGTALITRLNWR